MKTDRFYNSGGVWVPSGTTVLPRPDLMQWAADCAIDLIDLGCRHNLEHGGIMSSVCTDEIFSYARTAYSRLSMEAADYGTYIHALCEYSLTNDVKVESPHDMTNDFMAGLWKWKLKHNVKVIVMECEVLSKWYGGRLDLVCELDGIVTLIDFKTGKGSYYDTWKYQLAGYRQAYNDMQCWDKCEVSDPTFGCLNCPHKIQSHGILKFNKKKTKTKGYSANYKDFTEYQATRTQKSGNFVNGKLETEKYTRNYETDRATFNSLVANWWLINRGIDIRS